MLHEGDTSCPPHPKRMISHKPVWPGPLHEISAVFVELVFNFYVFFFDFSPRTDACRIVILAIARLGSAKCAYRGTPRPARVRACCCWWCCSPTGTREEEEEEETSWVCTVCMLRQDGKVGR